MITRSLTHVRVQGRLQREEGGYVHEQQSEKTAEAKYDHSTHTTVLLEEVLANLDIQPTDIVFDATAGRGGHSFLVLDKTEARVLAVDADPDAVLATRGRLEKFKERVEVVEGNFSDAEKIIKKHTRGEVQKAIFDLGWNLSQLASGRGFSFLHDEPLSMSYGPTPASGFNAQEILNEWDETTLADVFYGYGEEQYSRRIARAIIERRVVKPIETTLELAELIRDAVPPGYRRGRLHPATKTFQALRIAVNDELGVIERGVTGVWNHLGCGGRIAVISFHSIEDRVVKHLFQDFVKNGGVLINKKPLVPSRNEIISNPRARSAKLRVIEKICTK